MGRTPLPDYARLRMPAPPRLRLGPKPSAEILGGGLGWQEDCSDDNQTPTPQRGSCTCTRAALRRGTRNEPPSGKIEIFFRSLKSSYQKNRPTLHPTTLGRASIGPCHEAPEVASGLRPPQSRAPANLPSAHAPPARATRRTAFGQPDWAAFGLSRRWLSRDHRRRRPLF